MGSIVTAIFGPDCWTNANLAEFAKTQLKTVHAHTGYPANPVDPMPDYSGSICLNDRVSLTFGAFAGAFVGAVVVAGVVVGYPLYYNCINGTKEFWTRNSHKEEYRRESARREAAKDLGNVVYLTAAVAGLYFIATHM